MDLGSLKTLTKWKSDFYYTQNPLKQGKVCWWHISNGMVNTQIL